MMAIRVDRLSKRYGARPVLDQVSFGLPRGETLVVHGPSGSGKSTLLRLLAGLELPDQGEILLMDRLASRPGWALEPHRRGVGFVFQSPALWPHLTVAQHVLFGLRRWPKPEARRRLEELLAEARLEPLAGRFPDELSGGEARRVALIRSLAPRPPILLLDEPLTNLDPELKAELLGFVQRSIRASEASVVYVTHDPAEARQVSSRTIALRDGQVVEPGPGAALAAGGAD
jgi:ABC-type sulfate/molybdate transport systems ATPase subunit